MPFWDIDFYDFKLFIKKPKTQKEASILLAFWHKRFRQRNLLQEGDLRMFVLA